SIPNFTIACVCPPHTSIIVHGRVTASRIAPAKRLAASESRYSSRNFTRRHYPMEKSKTRWRFIRYDARLHLKCSITNEGGLMRDHHRGAHCSPLAQPQDKRQQPK